LFFQQRKRADEAVRRNKQLEKEADDARQRLSQLSAELESALQAYRNYQSELIKVKSLNEQLTEQIEIITRDKRRLQGLYTRSFFLHEKIRFTHMKDK